MKTYIITAAICLFSICAIAQRGRDQIKALKVAHITERLNLTEKEAQQFWPVYNAYDTKTSKLKREDLRKILHEIRENNGSLSDAKANELLSKLITIEDDLHKEKTTLVTKLKKIISPQKIIQLKIAEEEFNRMMLNRMKKMRQERMKKNKP